MLRKVNKALLISDVATFYENYEALAEDIGVSLQVEHEWNSRYRVNADVIILGSKNLESLNETYYPETILILKEGESPAPYIKMGIVRFIFNYKNRSELLTALFKPDPIIIHFADSDYDEIIKTSKAVDFCYGDYDFRFARSQFKYKGRMIYLTDSSKKYLAQWLLNGIKDNSRRMILCNLRKKFGEAFLSDIDRFGQLKGGKEA